MKRFLHLKEPLKNEKGMAILLVMLVFVVVSVMGIGIFSLSSTNLKQSSSERDYQSTYYIAESGVTNAMQETAPKLLGAYDAAKNETEFFAKVESELMLGVEKTYSGFEESFGEKPVAIMKIERLRLDSPTREYKITSTGKIGNRTRTVEKTFSVTWKPKTTGMEIPVNRAVFVNDRIELIEGANINGTVATNSSANGSISLSGGSNITGDIYVGPNAGTGVISKPDYINVRNPIKLPATKTFALPEFPSIPSYPSPENTKVYNGSNSYDVILNGALRIDNWMTNNYTLNLDRDMSFSEIKITSNYQLYINTGNEDRKIVVHNLNVPNGKITLLGSGKLTIYVTGNITMDSGSVINTGKDIQKLNIYLKGSGVKNSPKSLSLTGSQQIYGSLFAEDANISFSNGSGFQGNILTGGKNISISGGAYANSSLFYAPNAEINLSGGAELKGVIVAKSFIASGGSKLYFMQLNSDNIPFQPDTGELADIENILATKPTKEKKH